MDHAQRPDDLAGLRAELLAQRAEIAALKRRRRLPRRALPVLLATLLVALVPLATLAANPFNDLTGGVHDANIDAIYTAGITRGCDPDVSYCPTGLVTREEMASFLARTAGLGDNPPVANALTAQLAATAQRAVTAQTANSAQDAAQLGGLPASAYQRADQPIANATNASTVGGYAANALNRVSFNSDLLTMTLGSATTPVARVAITIPGDAPQAVVVRGQINIYGQISSGDIVTRLLADDGSVSSSQVFPYQTTDPETGINVTIQWIFVAQPGTHTYTLTLRARGVAVPLILDGPVLIATSHPFGSTGDPGALDLPPTSPAPDRRP